MLDSKFFKWCYEHRHPIFLVGLLLFFILPEIFEKIFLFKIRISLMISVLIFSSIMIIHTEEKKRTLTYFLVIGIFLIITILSLFDHTNKVEFYSFVLLFIYFSFISYYLYLDIRHSKNVTGSVVFGAFAGYFLVGVLFFFVFVLLDITYPDTTNVDMTSDEGLDHTLYFSFITLTTIGYGDFAPTSTLGQKIAIVEGLIGQFYIAIVMATIVGKFLSTKSESEN